MPLIRFPTPAGLVYTIDLSKIADRENPRTVEAPVGGEIQEPVVIEWGDGSSEVVSSGTFPVHTYTDGTGDVFTVTLRSATGHLPFCYFNTDGKDMEPTAAAITTALISIDHFAGWMGNNSLRSYGSGIRHTINLEYVDPRIVGLPKYSRLANALQYSGIEQPLRSFCFDFVTQSDSFAATFYRCYGISGPMPSDLFDQHKLVTTFSQTFGYCSGLTGAPYIFWKADGSLDTDKFPILSTGTNAYMECSAAIRAQVPAVYGGTMTVS